MSAVYMNKAIIGGRLTADPELKQTPTGVFVCSFTVAVKRRTNRDETDFINCSAWRQTAEFIAQHFKKGSPIIIYGAVQTKKWTDEHGATRTITEIVSTEVLFVESRKDADYRRTFQVEQESTETEPKEPQGVQQTVMPKFTELTGDQDLPF